jgi:hypothetical protein
MTGNVHCSLTKLAADDVIGQRADDRSNVACPNAM